MKSIITGLLLLASSAFAQDYIHQDVSFMITSHTGARNRVYYSCDSVESRVENILSQMGAKNIKAHCSGGIDRNGRAHMPAYLRVNFDALTIENTDQDVTLTQVEIKERDNCHLNNSIVKNVLAGFYTNNVVIKSCSAPDSRTRISMEVYK